MRVMKPTLRVNRKTISSVFTPATMASPSYAPFALAFVLSLAAACGSTDDGAPSESSDTSTATSVGASGDDTSMPSTTAPSSTTDVADDSGTSAADSSTGDAPSDCPEPPVEPPCEAVGAGRCFYIDPIAGDDAGDGSAAAPWQTFVNIDSSIYYGTYPPAPQWVELHSGDVVYVREGTISQVFHPGDDSGPEGGGSYLVHLRGLDGSGAPITLEAYPGERPVLEPGEAAIAIDVLQSNGIVIDGFEIRGAYGRGIRIVESQDVEVARVLVYDTDGTVADNLAGLEILASTDVEVHDSVFADNYDRAAARAGEQTENSGNLVLFGNTGVIAIRRCAFYQSEGPDSQFSGFGVKYKHASSAPDASFEITDSYFEGNSFGIGIGTAHADVHHNVIVDSGVGITSQDFGGDTHQWDQRLSANTVVARIGLHADPTLEWIDDENGPWPDLTENAVERNIVVDTTDMHSQDQRTVLFSPYIGDEEHDAYASGLVMDDNCYHRDGGAVSFGFAESESYGITGGAFDLEGWRAAYGFDLASVEADPELTELVPASDGPCALMGAFTDDHAPAIDFADPLACGDAATTRRWL